MEHYGRVLTTEEFQPLQDRFDVLPEHGLMIPAKEVSFYDRPPGKVGVPIPLFEAWLCPPTSNFFDMIVKHYILLSMSKPRALSIRSSVLNRTVALWVAFPPSGF